MPMHVALSWLRQGFLVESRLFPNLPPSLRSTTLMIGRYLVSATDFYLIGLLNFNNCKPTLVPTLHVNLILFVNPCIFLGGIIDLWCCDCCHLLSDSFIQIPFVRDNISFESVKISNMPIFFSTVGMDFIEMSIIHDNTCRVVYKKCY
jgi:hypothetical protein